MIKAIKSLMVMALLLVCGSAFAAGYTKLSQEMPTHSNKIEVLEFFFYECSHCNDLNPALDAWKKTMPEDVELIYVPTMFSNRTEPLARTFYALEVMGKIDELDNAIYDEIHKNKNQLRDLDDIAKFVESKGIDRKKFEATYKSFSIQSKVTRAKQMIRSYQIQGTPTIIVDGKYVITGLHPEQATKVLSEVIEIARKEKK